MTGRITLLISDWLLDEVTRTLAKPYFQLHVTVDVYRLITEALRTTAIRVPIGTPIIGIASHPEDDFVLATAVSAQADYLVTGDKQLQRLENVEGVSVVSPRDFLDALQEEA
jgi:putative PIN family toxin of toxin-antitoxin system